MKISKTTFFILSALILLSFTSIKEKNTLRFTLKHSSTQINLKSSVGCSWKNLKISTEKYSSFYLTDKGYTHNFNDFENKLCDRKFIIKIEKIGEEILLKNVEGPMSWLQLGFKSNYKIGPIGFHGYGVIDNDGVSVN